MCISLTRTQLPPAPMATGRAGPAVNQNEEAEAVLKDHSPKARLVVTMTEVRS
jgi:hypothetical protein